MTEKERLCVIEWFNNGMNGTNADMSVFKNCKKRSSARVNFSKMMKKNDVRVFRDELINTEIATTGEIMMYLTRVMRGQEMDAFGLKVSIDDRLKAAEKLMKAKGMFTQKIELNQTEKVVIIDDIPED